ncbi:MAG TPA: DUF998 domain-containing protein [Candidatus Limnocylindria bacterium]|nr:DUF998 domain-containing protein [Candidatus Limnocylindria bacterium]
MRRLALGGITGPVLFAVVVLVCGALRPEYSHLQRFISELGAAGTPYAALMNYAGFVPAGFMLALFGVALAFVLPGGRLIGVAATLVTAFGLGIAASGMISCDIGCPQHGSLENVVHNAIAPVSFLCLIAATAMFGIRFRSLPAWRHLWLYSLLTSAGALCLLAVLGSSLDSRVLTGLWQRLMLAVLFIWCAIVGLKAFRNR